MSWKQEPVPPAPPAVRFADNSLGESFWFDDDGYLMFETIIQGYTNKGGEMVMDREELLAFFHFLADELGYEIEG
jgi:hypothetical protein